MHGVHEPVVAGETSITIKLSCDGSLRIEEDGKGLYKLFYKSVGEHAEERPFGAIRKSSVESCIPLFTWKRRVVIETNIAKLQISDPEEILKLKEWVKNSQSKETKD